MFRGIDFHDIRQICWSVEGWKNSCFCFVLRYICECYLVSSVIVEKKMVTRYYSSADDVWNAEIVNKLDIKEGVEEWNT